MHTAKELFFNEAQETFAVFDKNLNFLEVNKALLKALHLKKEQVVGKNVREISPGIENTERYKTYHNVMATGIPATIDEVTMHPSLGSFIVRISLFKTGDGLGMTALNITDLREALDELETFVYKSSHDMRSPIATVLGLINLAESEFNDSIKMAEYIGIIKQQTQRLDSIIKNLVGTTSIRKKNKVIQLVDFNAKINSVKSMLSDMRGFKKIRFSEDIDVKQKFYCDRHLLLTLFQNLIDNAVKYSNTSRKDSYINIKIEDEAGGIKIIVSDNGIGIPEQFQKDVFKMFFRATDQASGAGLGLYTVKQAVKKLGGHISLKSEEKIGTTFSVYLPNNVSS
jgi:signal transduction histidine kinase